jgi:riboflavin kinase / FMN adenylyltransferase
MITKGKVLEGHKKANGIGFPTANIVNINNVHSGIYAGRVGLNGVNYDAVLYVGEKRKDILEAHLFDFQGDLYNKEIEVNVIEKIREDEEVDDFSVLKDMIKKDCDDAKFFLSTN